jgi:RNA polymerase primary sigma factor
LELLPQIRATNNLGEQFNIFGNQLTLFSFYLLKLGKGAFTLAEVKRKYKGEERSLDLYLREIGETPLISSQEEISLARRIKEGDKEALEELTKANLRFVVSVAKQYQNQGLSLADLINEGNIGLIKAAKRFDETRGFKFISYAVWWIRQAILQALAEQSRIVRLPLNRVGALHRIGKISSNLEQEFGREPMTEEIAERLEMTPEEVSETLKISNNHLSLDAPFNEGEDSNLLDVLKDEFQPAPDRDLLGESLKVEIGKALGTLTEREAEVIILYFGIKRPKPMTLEEIGNRFNLTRERVRQIKEKAIRRLRHASRSRRLKAFVN